MVRLSGFNIYVEGFPEPGSTLVHNTFSGAYVVLGNDDLELLRRADRGEELTETETAAVSDPELWDSDVAICVANRKTEEAEFRQWFEMRRSGKEMTVTFGINLACNFDCPYCSQATVMSGKVMDEETCDASADWLVNRAHAIDADSLTLAFVGGEPLLHPARIKRVASRIRENLRDGIRFSFTLITNGYFLSGEMVDELKTVGLTGAQITLDGDEHTHSLTRVSKKGEDTFKRLFDNAIAASRKISIIINGNYQENTVAGFGPLITKLAKAGLPQGSKVSFSPALEGLSTESNVGSGSCTFSGTDMLYQPALFDLAKKNGFDTPSLHAIGPCSYHEKHGYAIDPDGALLKCPGFLGHAGKWAIGTVRDGLNDRYDQLVNRNPQRECGGCTHRPNCGGGCVAAQWVELGRTEGVNCEVTYFDSIAAAGVKREYNLAAYGATGKISETEALPAPKRRLPLAAV